jgi:hypothetical protein
MMEAYNAVYAPQELTEEQVWEEVEAWVNSLVEEGHDLSEYTWEDMYEEYLNEIVRPTTGQLTAPRNAPPASPKPTAASTYRPGGGGMGGMRGSGRDRTSYQTSSSPGALRVQPTNAPYQSRFAGARDAAFDRARQIQGSPVVGPRVAAPAPTRPTAPAPARPVAQTSARPVSAPAPAPTATAPATRTPNPLMQRTFGYQTGQAPSQVASTRAATTTAASNLTGTGALATRPATPAPAPAASAPKPNTQQQIRQRRLNMDLDLFDIVKGYLIDEGYAETEEAAAVIMANMSDEWRQSIVEGLTPLGVKTAGVVDDQRRGSTRDKDLKGTRDALDKMKAYPNGFPGVKGV